MGTDKDREVTASGENPALRSSSKAAVRAMRRRYRSCLRLSHKAVRENGQHALGSAPEND
jgi:hypothetical protein